MKLTQVLVTGNKLKCDCRLSWIQVLRNETKSEPLRIALDEVTCIINTANNNKATNTDNKNIANDDKVIKNENMFELESNSEVLQQDGNEEDAYDTTAYNTVKQVAVVDIPSENLRCAGEVIRNGEDSLMLSSKDESYWQPSSSFKILSNLSLVLTLVIVCSFQ